MLSNSTSVQADFSPILDHPLGVDGLKVCELSLVRGQLKFTKDLRHALDQVDEHTIVLVPRAAIAPSLIEEITREAFDGHKPEGRNESERWNEAGGFSVTNALPHLHDTRNCHAAPQPSDCPTAFFTRGSIISAVEEVALNRRFSFEIRSSLQGALAQIADDNTDSFFEYLHDIQLSSGSNLDLLRCVQAVQAHAEADGGVFRVNLGRDGCGIVGIPAFSVHGRFVVQDIAREFSTAWRYFPR